MLDQGKWAGRSKVTWPQTLRQGLSCHCFPSVCSLQEAMHTLSWCLAKDAREGKGRAIAGIWGQRSSDLLTTCSHKWAFEGRDCR